MIIRACDFTKPAPKGYRQKRHTNDRNRAIVLVLLDTGLRVSECARLQVRDINIDVGEVNVEPFGSAQKTKGRIGYIGALTKKLLWKFLANRDVLSDVEPLFIT